MKLWQIQALVLSLPCAALGQASDGPWLATAATLGFERSSPISSPATRGAEFFYKESGLGTTPPSIQGIAGAGIDFSSHGLFRACASDPIVTGPLPEIDGLSLGEDLLNVGPTGRISIAADRWAGMLFSVRRGATGAKGSRLESEIAKGDPAASLFSYSFWPDTPPSKCVPSVFLGQVTRAWNSIEAGIPKGCELDTIDVLIAHYREGTWETIGLTDAPSLYYSVAESDIALVPNSWWGTLPRSGATIFRSIWDKASMRWSRPTAVFSPTDLGLGNEEDVDAFSYNAGSRMAIFSTTPDSKRNQLLFANLATDGTNPQDVTTVRGLLSDELGLGGADDVDGVCYTDPPCYRSRVGQRRQMAAGVPWEPSYPLSPTFLNSQAYRMSFQQGMGYRFVMTGAPSTQQSPAYAVLFANPPGVLAPIYLGGTPVPTQTNGNAVLLNIPTGARKLSFDAIWVSIGGPGPIGLSVPVRVHVP